MDYNFLITSPLFKGITASEAETVCACLKAKEKTYTKGNYIFRLGDTAAAMGLVLSGSVSVESSDLWGARIMLDRIEPGQIFAETYACLTEEPMMVDVIALEKTTVLFLNMQNILQTCPSACRHHHRLLKNLLEISAGKNLSLSRRSLHTAPKSIRERVRSFLSYQAVKNRSNDFLIPFNRQQMADYLNVDRSALSAELGKMRKEELLDFERSRFILLKKQM